MIKIDIITLFPYLINGFFNYSILKNAIINKYIKVNIHDMNDFVKKKTFIDDYPTGGGEGLIIRPELLFLSIKYLKKQGTKIIYPCPDGKLLKHGISKKLVNNKHLLFIAGHYEGIDCRIRERLIDEEISIGDYILTNGAIASIVIIDSLVRLIPGVLGNKNCSIKNQSFSNNLLSFPHYTKPSNFKTIKVPSLLLSGNHDVIKDWKIKKQIYKTKIIRKDLINNKEIRKK